MTLLTAVASPPLAEAVAACRRLETPPAIARLALGSTSTGSPGLLEAPPVPGVAAGPGAGGGGVEMVCPAAGGLAAGVEMVRTAAGLLVAGVEIVFTAAGGLAAGVEMVRTAAGLLVAGVEIVFTAAGGLVADVEVEDVELL